MTGLAEVSPYMSDPALCMALGLLGLLLGVLIGLFGVGGGFLIVPLLNVVFGIEYTLAKGSSLACILGASVSGLGRHVRLHHVAVRTMLIISGGAMCGAMLGGMLNDWLEQSVCSGDEHLVEMTTHPMYIVLLLAAAWFVYRGSDDGPQGRTVLQRLPVGPRIRIRLAGQEGVSLPGLVVLGLLIGVFTGLLGVGGGVVMMPLLLAVVGLRPRQAIGTSLGIVLFASAAGTVKYAMIDQVNLWIAMSILVGSTLGIQVGARLCTILHAGRIRRYFAILVLAVVILVAIDFIELVTRG